MGDSSEGDVLRVARELVLAACCGVVDEVLSGGLSAHVLDEDGEHREYVFDAAAEERLTGVLMELGRRREIGIDILAESTVISLPGEPVLVGLIDPIDGSWGLSYAAGAWPEYRRVVGRGPNSSTVISLGLLPSSGDHNPTLDSLNLFSCYDHGSRVEYLALRGADGLLRLERPRWLAKMRHPPIELDSGGRFWIGGRPPIAVLGFQNFRGWQNSTTVAKLIGLLSEANFEVAVEETGSTSIALLKNVASAGLYVDIRLELARAGEGRGNVLKLYDVSSLPAIYSTVGLKMCGPRGEDLMKLPLWDEFHKPTPLSLVAGPPALVEFCLDVLRDLL
ncbi:MAG TPA: hypothetical protein ENG69_00515 [Candidatus Korarchaeota archaeon]|nr:hypothetical protein [Candidatus Korarchaeota archaeon]